VCICRKYINHLLEIAELAAGVSAPARRMAARPAAPRDGAGRAIGDAKRRIVTYLVADVAAAAR